MCVHKTSSVSLLISLSLLFFVWFGLRNETGEGTGTRDCYITVSPHCGICHMDTRDYLWVRGQVNSSNAAPDTRGRWGGHALSVCVQLGLHVQRSWFSKDFPKIYKLPREKQSVARKSYTLLTCYFKSECYAPDFAAKHRWKEGVRSLCFYQQRIICVLTGCL